jgi:hypothetical protein
MSSAKSADKIQRDYVAAMGADLGGEFYRFWTECSRLHLNWYQYELLFGSGPSRVAILNGTAGTFFGLVQARFFEATLLHLARLTDWPVAAGKENLTLARLPDLVDEKLRPRVAALLKDVNKRCRFAQGWRHRLIAHRDLQTALKPKARRLPEASRTKVNIAIAAIADLLNAVEAHYCRGATTVYGMLDPPDAAEAMLYVLRDGLEVAAARRMRIASGAFTPDDVRRQPPL